MYFLVRGSQRAKANVTWVFIWKHFTWGRGLKKFKQKRLILLLMSGSVRWVQVNCSSSSWRNTAVLCIYLFQCCWTFPWVLGPFSTSWTWLSPPHCPSQSVFIPRPTSAGMSMLLSAPQVTRCRRTEVFVIYWCHWAHTQQIFSWC